MRRTLASFVIGLLLAGFLPVLPASAEFFCWCRNASNVCNNYNQSGTYDAATSPAACTTFCTGRGETVIATEPPYGTEYDERAADICSTRGDGGACAVGGSCTERHAAGVSTLRFSCRCQITQSGLTSGVDIYSPSPDYVTAETESDARSACHRSCLRACDSGYTGTGEGDPDCDDDSPYGRWCSANPACPSTGVDWDLTGETVARLTGEESVATTPPPPAPGTGEVVGPGGSRGGPAPTLPNPLGGSTDIRTIIGRVINAALGISGSIALLMFIWGGLQWLTSGGSPERIQKGKNTIVWAVLGLVLIFGSYAILNFVLGAILSA